MSSLRACRSALLEHNCDSLRCASQSAIPSLLMDAFERGKDARILGPRGIAEPKIASKLSLTRRRPSHGSVASSHRQSVFEKKPPAVTVRRRRELRFGPAPESVEFPGPDAYSPSLQSTGGFANSPRWSLGERYSRGGSFDMYGVNVDIAPWSYDIPSTMQICPKRRRKKSCDAHRFPRVLSRSPGPCAYTPREMKRSVRGAWDHGVRPGMSLPEDDFTPGPGTYNTNTSSSPLCKMATIGRAGAAPTKCSLTITDETFRERRGRRLSDVGSTLNLTSGRSFGRASPVRGIPMPESGAGDLGPGTYGSFLKHHAVGKLKSWTSCQGRNPPGSRWMESCLDSESEDEEPC